MFLPPQSSVSKLKGKLTLVDCNESGKVEFANAATGAQIRKIASTTYLLVSATVTVFSIVGDTCLGQERI